VSAKAPSCACGLLSRSGALPRGRRSWCTRGRWCWGRRCWRHLGGACWSAQRG